MGALGVFKPRGIEKMFWAHWEPKGRYVWSVRETGCVSPLMQRVFCCYSDCCVYIRGSGANFLRILTLLILLIKGPVHGENCVNMCIVNVFSLCYFGPHFYVFLYVVYFLRLQLFFEFFSKQPFMPFGIDFFKHILRNCKL
jgi:hypothetical protein